MGVTMTKKERTAGLTAGQLKDIIRTAKVVYKIMDKFKRCKTTPRKKSEYLKVCSYNLNEI